MLGPPVALTPDQDLQCPASPVQKQNLSSSQVAALGGARAPLAADMPGMAECAKFFDMCDEAGSTFWGLCGGGGGGGDRIPLPPMRMYLHQSVAGGRRKGGNGWGRGSGGLALQRCGWHATAEQNRAAGTSWTVTLPLPCLTRRHHPCEGVGATHAGRIRRLLLGHLLDGGAGPGGRAQWG